MRRSLLEEGLLSRESCTFVGSHVAVGSVAVHLLALGKVGTSRSRMSASLNSCVMAYGLAGTYKSKNEKRNDKFYASTPLKLAVVDEFIGL